MTTALLGRLALSPDLFAFANQRPPFQIIWKQKQKNQLSQVTTEPRRGNSKDTYTSIFSVFLFFGTDGSSRMLPSDRFRASTDVGVTDIDDPNEVVDMGDDPVVDSINLKSMSFVGMSFTLSVIIANCWRLRWKNWEAFSSNIVVFKQRHDGSVEYNDMDLNNKFFL